MFGMFLGCLVQAPTVVPVSDKRPNQPSGLTGHSYSTSGGPASREGVTDSDTQFPRANRFITNIWQWCKDTSVGPIQDSLAVGELSSLSTVYHKLVFAETGACSLLDLARTATSLIPVLSLLAFSTYPFLLPAASVSVPHPTRRLSTARERQAHTPQFLHLEPCSVLLCSFRGRQTGSLLTQRN